LSGDGVQRRKTEPTNKDHTSFEGAQCCFSHVIAVSLMRFCDRAYVRISGIIPAHADQSGYFFCNFVIHWSHRQTSLNRL